ncbi:hypothetical protein ACJJTC_001092 [Scirpophaga incertulas]
MRHVSPRVRRRPRAATRARAGGGGDISNYRMSSGRDVAAASVSASFEPSSRLPLELVQFGYHERYKVVDRKPIMHKLEPSFLNEKQQGIKKNPELRAASKSRSRALEKRAQVVDWS